jgi:AcrR family transcriptional regulator
MLNRTRLDQAAVVEAAANLVNEEGIAALTLNRLAGRLGIRPPSLYNHIDNLADLYRKLAQVNARALGEQLGNAAIGKSGAEAIVCIAQAYRDYIKQNPGVYLASLRASRNQEPPDLELLEAEDRVVRVVLKVMDSFGLDGEDALHAVRGLRSLVHGFATLEIAGGFGLSLDCDESFRCLVEIYTSGLQQA